MEIELKLALPTDDPQGLVSRLEHIPLLARRKAVQQKLHNIYFDTPEQILHQRRVALRLRRVVGNAGQTQWLQTLKMGGSGESALSQRGEWETAIPRAQLDASALAATPWSTLDPDGSVFLALTPYFTTEFTRTIWTLRQRDGSAVEVALDIGHITVDNKTIPIFELELELLTGQPCVLFDVAQKIAANVATLPLGISKAQRGYALVRSAAHAPQPARPPALTPDMPVADAALRVLRETFSHFTANLHGLLHSHDPELIHQARIGWRRFKTGLKLFEKFTDRDAPVQLQALRPLLAALGAQRNLDVASQQTLPMLANAYTDGDQTRQTHWRAMEQALGQATDQQRDTLHATLCDPCVGAALLATTRWLEIDLATLAGAAVADPKHALQDWARQQVKHWHSQLKKALALAAQSPEKAHRARIRAKRLRYGIEALRPLLPKRRAKHWHLQATQLQADMGSTRDILQALAIATDLHVARSLLDFLRGYASASDRGM